jgi:catechol 2,3-dioxygenase-like lactoylglutathione lyase family enzyme
LEAIDHLDLVVSDLERGLDFYAGLLSHLGYVDREEIVGEQGEPVVYLSRKGGGGSVSLREAHDGRRQRPFDRYDLGIHHICFAAEGRDRVDEIAAWVKQNGGEIESEPREYGYTPGYYAVFFYDPDGIKLEVLHRP